MAATKQNRFFTTVTPFLRYKVFGDEKKPRKPKKRKKIARSVKAHSHCRNPVSLAVVVPNFRARRLALGLALLVMSGASALAITQGAPAQDSAEELEAKMGELESNVDQQGDLQSRIDAQNEQINSVIAAESELRRKADGVQAELDERQAELDEATQELNDQKAYLAEIRARLNRAMAALEDLLVADVQVERRRHARGRPQRRTAGTRSSARPTTSTASRSTTRPSSSGSAGSARRSRSRSPSLQEVQERIKVARDEVAARRAELADAQSRDRGRSTPSSSRCAPSARPTWRRCRRASPTLEKDLGHVDPGPGRARGADRRRGRRARRRPAGRQGRDRRGQQHQRQALRLGRRPRLLRGLGYDCSGAVSYALNGGGLIDSPLDSGGFTAWGSPGGGNWITVYANYGHVYMVVAGLRFDTSMTRRQRPALVVGDALAPRASPRATPTASRRRPPALESSPMGTILGLGSPPSA